MITLNRNQGESKSLGLFVVSLLNCFLIGLPFDVAQQAQSRHGSEPQQSALAKAEFSRGIFLYNNDDISDAAAKQFKQVAMKYPNTKEAETALYYLGSYYQRKCYIYKERRGELRKEVLNQAVQGYTDYIRKYSRAGSSQWLSDARFNLSLVYLQLGDLSNAMHQLKEMFGEASKDASVYIYQIVWSPNAGDVIDYRFDTKQLADFTLYVLSGHQAQQTKTSPTFEQNVELLKKWCKSQKRPAISR